MTRIKVFMIDLAPVFLVVAFLIKNFRFLLNSKKDYAFAAGRESFSDQSAA